MTGIGPDLRHTHYLIDALIIRGLLKKKGPKPWHDLEIMAASNGVDIDLNFDRAVLSALRTGIIEAQFSYKSNEQIDKLLEKDEAAKKEIQAPPKDLILKLLEERSAQIKAGAKIDTEEW